MDGGVYSFKNVYSSKYLTVHEGNTAQNTNINQKAKDNTESQAFRLSYNETTEGWLIKAMCSSNGYGSALTQRYHSTIDREDGYMEANVFLHEYYDAPTWQEWLIIPVGIYYKIVSMADPNLALTSYATGNGTADGTTATSLGNVFVAPYTGSTNQLWTLESGGAEIITTPGLINAVNANTEYSIKYGYKWLRFCSPVTDFGDTVTFSSSDPSIASIDENGLVSTKRTGRIVITIKVNHLSGSESIITITLNVIFKKGVYFIKNCKDNKYIEPYGNGTTYDLEGRACITGVLNCGKYQQWYIEETGNGLFKIISEETGKALSVLSSAVDSENAPVVQETYSGAANQLWHITMVENNVYSFSPSSNDSYYMMSSGSSVRQRISQSDNSDNWIIESAGETDGIVDGGIYNLQVAHSDKVVTVTNGSTDNGSTITQHDFAPGSQSQRWQINYIGNSEYKIKDINSGKLLSIEASSGDIDANVHLWEDDGTTGQIFRIRQNDDGTYTFLTKCSNYTKVIDLYCSSQDNGANFLQYHDLKTSNQKFNLLERNNAIIIVPGFGGSVLQMGSNFPLNGVWSNNDVFSGERWEAIFSEFDETSTEIKALWDEVKDLNGDFDFNTLRNVFVIDNEYLFAMESAVLLFGIICNSNGESVFDLTPKPFNPLYGGDDVYGAFNTYATLYNNLKDNVIGSKISTSYSNYDVTLFSYDWRMSCADSADELDEFIERYEYDSVVLVCHSMGGLVGSAYMASGEAQREKVEKYVSYGTPHWGTTVASTVCLTGKKIDIFMGMDFPALFDNDVFYSLFTELIVQYVLSNIPSVYEMLPTDRYVSATGGYLKYEDGELCTTYSSTKTVIANHMKGYKASLMSSAEAFHNSLYIGTQHVTEFTDRVFVYSNSRLTVQYLTYDPAIFNFFSYTISSSGSGDSVVPSVSATMNFSDDAEEIPDEENRGTGHKSITYDAIVIDAIFFGG